MKNLKKGLESVSRELKALGTKAEKLVKEVEKALKTTKTAKPKAAKKKAAAKKAAKKKVVKKATAKKAPAKKKTAKKASAKKASAKKVPAKKTSATAIETVVGIIKRSQKGVDVETLIKKTGYDAKKISNLVYKAKKRGDIKSGAKGIYVKK
ncbi:MAG: hypothetical protein R6X10_13770 [Desulfobacterales bacterium]